VAKPKKVREKKPRPVVPEITLVKPFETYPGSTFTRETADEMSIGRIHHGLLKKEAQLFDQKWFDYRRLHPTVATHYFVHCYTAAYSRTIKKAFDVQRGPWHPGVKVEWWPKLETSSFWRLRQQADGMGIPYYFFVCRLMDYFLDSTHWSRVPRPAHLGKDEAIASVSGAWEEALRTRLQLPEDTFYTAPAFVGHPYQIQCEAWLLEQAQRRSNPRYSIAMLIYKYAHVRECALDALPEQLQAEVRDLRGMAEQLSQH
jgi:hypothetical protein